MKRFPQSKVARWPQSVKKMALVYACCFVLIAMLSFGISYAYFTAKAESVGTITMGNLQVVYRDSDDINSTLETVVYRQDVSNAWSSVGPSNVAPGDRVYFSGQIKNTGTLDAYVLLQVELYKSNTDETEDLISTKYYTLDGTKIVYDTNNQYYSTQASSLTKAGGTKDSVALPSLDATQMTGGIYCEISKGITSDYSGSTFIVRLTVNAIQQDNIVQDSKYSDLSVQATNMMVNNSVRVANYIKIEGNTTQAETPTPTSPVALTSVGTQTVAGSASTGYQINVKSNSKNLFDISKVVSSSTVNSNGDGTLYMTLSQDSQWSAVAGGDATLKSYAPDLMVGKTYIFNADSTGTRDQLYLSGANYTWDYGTTKTITEQDLNSRVFWYLTESAGVTQEAVISNIQITEVINELETSLWDTARTDNGITVQYSANEECFVLNGTASGTAAVGATYFTSPINALNTKFVIRVEYITGNVDRTGATDGHDYAVAYFGNADVANSSNNWLNVTLQQSNTSSEVTTCNKNYITRFWFYISAGVKFANYKCKVILNRVADVEYTPYQEPVNTTINISEPLRSIGNIRDYYECVDGVAKVVRNVKSIILDGSEDWLTHVAEDNKRRFYFELDDVKEYSSALSSHFADIFGGINTNTGKQCLIIQLDDETFSTVDEFKTWLSSNNVEVLYELATSVTEQADPVIIKSLAGQTTYSVDGTSLVTIY